MAKEGECAAPLPLFCVVRLIERQIIEETQQHPGYRPVLVF